MSSDLSQQIAQAKEALEKGKTELLKTFQAVPDEKLLWSPSSTARSPVWMVAHCGAANQAFAAILRGEELPVSQNPEEAAAQIRRGGQDVTSRQTARQMVEDSCAEVAAALDSVTAERLASRHARGAAALLDLADDPGGPPARSHAAVGVPPDRLGRPQVLRVRGA